MRTSERLPGRRSLPVYLPVLASLLIGVSSLAVPLGFPGAPSITSVPTPSLTAAGPPRGSIAVTGAAQPTATVGPIGGIVYQTNESTPQGVVAFNRIAVDPTAQVLYSLNRLAGILTRVSLTSGAVLATYRIAYSPTIQGTDLVLNPSQDRLWVAVESNRPTGGSLLVFAATSLTLVGNQSAWPSPDFQPTYLLYDSASTQLLIENRSNALVAMFNTTTNSVSALLTPPCAPTCASLGGMADVPKHHYAVLPTGNRRTPLVNTSTDSLMTGILGPAGFVGGVATWLGATDNVWIDDASGTSNQIFSFTQGGANNGVLTGPVNVTAMIYDAPHARVVVAAKNTTAGYAEELWVFNSTFGPPLAHYRNPALSPSFYFWQLQAYVRLPSDSLVTAGAFEGTTIVLSLTALPPYLAPVAFVPAWPAIQARLAVDPIRGTFFVLARYFPAEVRAYRETSPSVALWTIEPNDHNLTSLAVDPGQGLLYLADATNNTITAWSELTGAYHAKTTLSFPPGPIAVDIVHELLYITDSSASQVEIYGTSGGSLVFVATVLTPGVVPCSVLPDSVREVLFEVTCSTPGVVTEVSGVSHTVSRVYPAGRSPDALALGGGGRLYVANRASQNISVLQPGASTPELGSIATPGFGLEGLGINPAGDWLFGTNSTILAMSVIDGINETVDGSIPAPAVLAPPQGDPTNGTILAPTRYDGTTFLVSVVPRPSAPSGLTLVSGNTTLLASWAAPAGRGPPVLSYRVYDSTGMTGPWATAATVGGSTLAANLTGLNDGTTYFTMVQAVNVAGAGPNSSVASGVPRGVPYPPGVPVEVGNGTSWIEFTWLTPSDDQGSPVTSYAFWYSVSGSNAWVPVSPPALALMVNLTGLTAGTKYVAYVVAYNPVGPSHPSAHAEAATLPMNAPSSGQPPSPSFYSSTLFYGLLAAIVAAVLATTLLLSRRRRRPPALAPTGASNAAPRTPSEVPPPWSESFYSKPKPPKKP